MEYIIFSLPVILLYIGNGFAHLYYAIKLKKIFPQEHCFSNSIIIFLLWLLAGLLYPFFFSIDTTHILLFLLMSMFFICIFTPGILFLIILYQYYISKNEPQRKIRRESEYIKKIYNNSTLNSNILKSEQFKTDLYRKALHLVPVLLIILLWFYAVNIWEEIWNADKIWGINGQNYAKMLIITVGYSGILVFAALDYIRLSFIFKNRKIIHLLPDNVHNLLKKSLKKKEYFEFTKPTALILSFVPIFLLFPFSIFASAALIATLGDGAASIFGIKFGKYKFPKTSNKTILGYIMGVIISFIVCWITFLYLEPNLSLLKIIIIAVGGAIMFFIIDLLSLKIDDNILNPLFCTIIIVIIYYYI